MARKRFTAGQIIRKQREAGVSLAQVNGRPEVRTAILGVIFGGY